MNVTLPNGTVINDVPDGTTKDQVMQKAISAGLATAQDFQQTAPAYHGPGITVLLPGEVASDQQQNAQPDSNFKVATTRQEGAWINAYNANGQLVGSARPGSEQANAWQNQSASQEPAAQQQQQVPASTPAGGSTPQNTDSVLSQTVQGIDEAARAIAQGAVNTVNIIPEIGDAVQSAGAWAGKQLGIGDGTYTPAARFSLPESLQPQTTAGQTAANVIPYLVPGVGPERAAAASAAGGNLAARATTGAARLAADTVPGALAQNSQQDNPQGLATDIGAGVAGGVVAKGVSAALSPIVSRVAQVISNRLPGAAERATQANISPGITPQQAVEQASPAMAPVATATPSASELTNVAQTANRATNAGASQQATQQFAQQVMPDQDVLQAARRLGLEDSLTPGMYSQNPAYRAFEIANATTPGTKMFQAHREAIGRLGQEADQFITDFGGSTDKSFVNHQVRSEYTRLVQNLKTQSDRIYNRISGQIPKRTIVNPEHTVQLIEDVADDVGGLTGLKNTYPILSKTLNQLQSAEGGGMHAASEVTPVTFGRLDAIRQQVGKALGSKINQGPFGDVDKNTLGRLYDALTTDQEKVVAAAGLDKEWNAAKQMVNIRKQVESIAVKNIGKNLNGDVVPPVQQAIIQMAQGGGKNFRSLVNDLPDTVKDAVVLTAMNKAFTSFAKSPGQQLGVPGFVKWYNGMARNKENLQALNNAIGYPAARRLHNIYVVANGMQRIGSEKVYSKTQIDRMLANFDKDSGLIGKIYGVARTAAKAEGITTAMHLPGVGTAHAIVSALNAPKVNRTMAADELMASPQFKDMSKKIFDPTPVRDAAERALENSKTYKSWLSTVTPAERSALLRRGMIGFLVSPAVLDDDSTNNPN